MAVCGCFGPSASSRIARARRNSSAAPREVPAVTLRAAQRIDRQRELQPLSALRRDEGLDRRLQELDRLVVLALPRVDRSERVQHAALLDRVVAGALQGGPGVVDPLQRVVVSRTAGTQHEGHRPRSLGRDLIVPVRLRGEIGLPQHGQSVVVPGECVEGGADRRVRLGEERAVVDLDRPRLSGLRPLQCLAEAARIDRRVGGLQLALDLLHLLRPGWIVRRRDAGQQRLAIGAPLDVGQSGRGLHRVLDRRLVGARPGVAQRGEAFAPHVEAGHAPVEQLVGLLVPHRRGLARVPIAGGPRACILVHDRLDAAPDVGRVRQLRRLERRRQLAPPRLAPHAAELRLRPATRIGLRAPQRERTAADDDSQCAHHQKRATAPAVAVELGEQDRHRRPPILRLGRQPAHHRAMHPARNVFRADLLDAAKVLLLDELPQRRARERPGAVQRLEQGHAEAELIGTGIGRLAVVLLGRHEGGRSHHGALLRQRGGQPRSRGADRQVDRLPLPVRSPGSSSARAKPKSITRARPSSPIITLAGLKSRCTTPAAWAAAIPRPASMNHARIWRQSGSVSPDPLPQRGTPNELHGDEHLVAVRLDVVDRHHVGMGQLRHRLGLPQQPLLRLRPVSRSSLSATSRCSRGS